MFLIESPVLKQLIAEVKQKSIIGFLTGRFGTVPPEVVAHLRRFRSKKTLNNLIRHAAQCPDLDAFRAKLFS
jgi:hypothetical protein